MGLIDGDQSNGKSCERSQHLRRHQAFRRKIEESRHGRPRRGARQQHCRPGPREELIVSAAIPASLSAATLILPSTRYERRHDDRQSAQDKRGHLEAQRLAGARRHDGEDVAPGPIPHRSPRPDQGRKPRHQSRTHRAGFAASRGWVSLRQVPSKSNRVRSITTILAEAKRWKHQKRFTRDGRAHYRVFRYCNKPRLCPRFCRTAPSRPNWHACVSQ